MARLKVRYFVEKPGANGVRFFWQPTGKLRAEGWISERLPEDRTLAIRRAEDLNRQLDAWRKGEAAPGAAAGKAGAVQPGTLAHVIRLYRKHRRYTKLRASTRKMYDQNIAILEAWAGDVQIASIGPKKVQKLYEAMYERTPAKANSVISILRVLLSHAVREEMVAVNAAAKAGLIAQPFSGKLWPIDAVSLFVEAADRKGWHSIGTAVVINHWIGQREGDILALKRSAYRDGKFHVTQRKTGKRIEVEHSPWVAARVNAEIARQKERKVEAGPQTALLLCETTGQPWKGDHFRHVFAEVRAAAAAEWPAFFLPDDSSVAMTELQFMHLRHTAVTELAIAGCTTLQIAGVTGHTPKSVEGILNRYLVRTSALAAAATDKRLEKGADIAALVVAATRGEQDENQKLDIQL